MIKKLTLLVLGLLVAWVLIGIGSALTQQPSNGTLGSDNGLAITADWNQTESSYGYQQDWGSYRASWWTFYGGYEPAPPTFANQYFGDLNNFSKVVYTSGYTSGSSNPAYQILKWNASFGSQFQKHIVTISPSYDPTVIGSFDANFDLTIDHLDGPGTWAYGSGTITLSNFHFNNVPPYQAPTYVTGYVVDRAGLISGSYASQILSEISPGTTDNYGGLNIGSFMGNFKAYKTTHFWNNWNITPTTGVFTIDIHKTVNGVDYPSVVYLFAGGDLLYNDATPDGADLSISTIKTPIKICLQDVYGNWYNSSDLYGPTYGLSFDPSNTQPGKVIKGTLLKNDGLVPNTDLTFFHCLYQDPRLGDYEPLFELNNNSWLIDYQLVGGHWLGWDDNLKTYSRDKGTTLPNPFYFLAPYGLAGSVNLGCHIITSTGSFQWIQNNLTLPAVVNNTIINVDIRAADTGALIQDANAGIFDPATGVWRNTTAPTGLLYYDSTGANYEHPLYIGEHIGVAAWSPDYQYQQTNFAIPYSNYRVALNLVPINTVNSTGAFTLVVNTVRDKDGLPISGMSVALDTGQVRASNSAGAAYFYNVTAGNRTITASNPDFGYQMAQKTVTGQPGETKIVLIKMVLNGESAIPVTTTGAGAGNISATEMNAAGGNLISKFLNMAIGASGLIGLLVGLWFFKKMISSM
jgi:hypothetical protein